MESLHNQTFLNFPDVVRSLFKTIGHCKNFCGLMKKLEEEEEISYSFETEIRILDQRFEDQVRIFISLINHLNQAGSTNFLSQLLVRLTFNSYFTLENNEMDIEGI